MGYCSLPARCQLAEPQQLNENMLEGCHKWTLKCTWAASRAGLPYETKWEKRSFRNLPSKHRPAKQMHVECKYG